MLYSEFGLHPIDIYAYYKVINCTLEYVLDGYLLPCLLGYYVGYSLLPNSKGGGGGGGGGV